MKFKIAAVALFASVAMICSESNGDLLSRMLGRGGCGGCQTASSCCDTPAPACGKTFGISININIGTPGRLFGGGGCGGGGLLRGGLLSGGCGGGCGGGEIATGGCGGGCGGEVVSDCGGGCGGGLLEGDCGGGSRLFSGRLLSKIFGGGGCDDGCGGGCDLAPSCGPTCGGVDSSCGCGGGRLFGGGMLSGGLLSGGCGGGCDTGCGAAPVAAPAPCFAPAPAPCAVAAPCASAPVASSCGCDNAPSCGCNLDIRGKVRGLFDRVGNNGCGSCGSMTTCGCGGNRNLVRGFASKISRPSLGGGCGCGSTSCGGGCEAPAPACGGCGDTSCGGGCGGSPIRGIFSKIPRPFKGGGCGCGVSSCDGGCGVSSCDSGCGVSSCDSGCGSNGLSLLDRLRGNRLPRNNCDQGNGCNPPCPSNGCSNSGCSSCGNAGAAMSAPCSGCSGGAVNYGSAPAYQESGSVIYGSPMQAAPVGQPAIQSVTPALPESTEGSVVVPSTDGARIRKPVVDPSAFVIKNN